MPGQQLKTLDLTGERIENDKQDAKEEPQA